MPGFHHAGRHQRQARDGDLRRCDVRRVDVVRGRIRIGDPGQRRRQRLAAQEDVGRGLVVEACRFEKSTDASVTITIA